MAKVTDQLVAMGHKAASGDCEEASDCCTSLRERHCGRAESLARRKARAALPQSSRRISLNSKIFSAALAAVRELTPRGSDYLLSFGELLSSLIVADAFTVRGLNAAWVDSRECLVTDDKQPALSPQMRRDPRASRKRKFARCFPRSAFR